MLLKLRGRRTWVPPRRVCVIREHALVLLERVLQLRGAQCRPRGGCVSYPKNRHVLSELALVAHAHMRSNVRTVLAHSESPRVRAVEKR
jgi:hypothetical protein